MSLQWRHNGRDGVSNHQPHDCLLNRLFGCRSKKTPKLRVTGFVRWPVTDDRWIPRTNGRFRGKCFHWMTSSWYYWRLMKNLEIYHLPPNCHQSTNEGNRQRQLVETTGVTPVTTATIFSIPIVCVWFFASRITMSTDGIPLHKFLEKITSTLIHRHCLYLRE